MTEDELRAALIDVRRAYRVTVAFQQRMNEVFYRFHRAVSAEGLAFQWWWPDRHARPAASGAPMFRPERWAWEMFPGHCMSAVWLDEVRQPSRRIWLGLDVDSAFNPARQEGGEPDPRTMLPAHDPRSRTEIWYGLYTAQGGSPDWDRVWREGLEVGWKKHIGYANQREWSVGPWSGTYVCERVSVEWLLSPAATDQELVAPVVRWARGVLDGG